VSVTIHPAEKGSARWEAGGGWNAIMDENATSNKIAEITRIVILKMSGL
jgi:hypothetical protein